MLEYKHVYEDDLKVKHSLEVLGHKSEEQSQIQIAQDEAIAAVFEATLAALGCESGDIEVSVPSEDRVSEICQAIVDKTVSRKVTTAVNKAIKNQNEEV